MSFHIPHDSCALRVNEERGWLYKAPSSHFVISWFIFLIILCFFIYLVSPLSLSHTYTHTQLIFSAAQNHSQFFTTCNTFPLNCGALSERMRVGQPCGKTIRSISFVAMVMARASGIVAVLVHRVKYSEMTKIYLFLGIREEGRWDPILLTQRARRR